MFSLRPYQESALQAVEAAEARGVRCQCIVLATGLGKTVIFSHLIARRGGRALVLAHRDELLQQAADKILKVIPGAHIGIVRGDLDQRQAQIVIASVPTLARKKRLERIVPDFSTVICDECHHASADSYGKIFEHIAPSNPLLLGVTATPDRADGKGIDQWFTEIVFEMGIAEGIDQGFLCDIDGRLVTIKGLDLSSIHTKRGDLDTTELEAVMKASNWHEQVARAFFEHARDRRTVIFVPKVQMAHDLAAHLSSNGVRAAAIDGSSDVARRRSALVGLSNGDLQVIVNCAVLTEGFDEPSLSCVIMCRPTKSRALYTQCIGRGLRLYPGKANCLVLDLVGVSQRHDLVSLGTLAGVRKCIDGETFRQAKLRAAVEAERETQRQKQAEDEAERLEVELAAHRVDLLQRNYLGNGRNFQNKQVSQFHWQIGIDNRRSLELKDRVVVVRPMADGSWIASDGMGWRYIGDSPEACQKAGEAHARGLLQPQKPWMREPASEKQLIRLREWRIPHSRAITKGEASALIEAAIGRRNARHGIRSSK